MKKQKSAAGKSVLTLPYKSFCAANIRAVVKAWATNAPPDYMAVG